MLRFKLGPLFIFILISGVIAFSWFRFGLYYGGAEVGLSPYYNPSRFLEIQKFIWWGDVAPGMLVPHFIVGVPFYFILSLFQSIFSAVLLQAIFTFILLFLMGYGMYKFSLSILGIEKRLYAVTAGLFYMFNSYTMVEVWHRFLYTGFFLAASLPILTILWRKWINKGNFYILALFLLINLSASYMFGNLTSAIVIWILLFMLTFFEFIFPWQGKKTFLTIGYRFSTGLFFWILTNLWWIIPALFISSSFLPEQHSNEDNIDTLVNISRQTILPYLLQFANPYYLFTTAELGQIYRNIIFLILPWIPAVVIFIGMIAAFKRKTIAPFGIIYILSILLAKGAAPPFGGIFIWGFINIYILGVIRNPFEKLGILLPFCGSILFVIGLGFIFDLCKKKIGVGNSKLFLFAICISVLIYAWPMFAGKVISKPNEPLLVEIPNMYKQADNWLNSQKQDGNILHLPFTGDVVTYNWEHGYHGVEINEILFTSNPSITRNVGVKRADDTLKSLTFLFNQPFTNNELVLKTLQDFNVRFIVLHKDVKWNDISTFGKNIKLNDPSEMEVTLNSFEFLEKSATFGDLVIYKLKDNQYSPKIIISDMVDLVYPGSSNIMQLISFFGNKIHTVTPLSENMLSQIPKIREISIFSTDSFDYNQPSERVILNPDSMIKQLGEMKSYFNQAGQLYSEDLVGKIILATDNLKKISQPSLDNYEDSIKSIFKNNFKTLSLLKLFKVQISNIFYSHLYILEQIGKQKPDERIRISEIQKNIVEGLRKNDLLPAYLSSFIPGNEAKARKILRFNIPIRSKYELIMSNQMADFYPNLQSMLDIRINNQPLVNSNQVNKKNISFGNFDFGKGNYEISYNTILSPNLVPSLDKFFRLGHVESKDSDVMYLSAQTGGIAYLESPIQIVRGKDVYKIFFEAQITKGTEFYLEITEDTEDFDNQKEYQMVQQAECSFHTCLPLRLDSLIDGWQNYSSSIPALNLATRKANIRILVTSGEILIRNFQVNRIYDEDIFLRNKQSEMSENSFGELISISHQSPENYTGKIRIDKPSFLFFKETFNPGWTLKLTKDGKTYKIDNHFIGDLYGNSYFIDKSGDYNFKLEFEPQKIVNKGLVLSTLGWVGLLIVLVWNQKDKKYESN